MSVGLPLMKNVLAWLAKCVLVPLGLTTAASTTDVAIWMRIHGSGITTLVFSNENLNDIMKIVKSFEVFTDN